jgi:ribosomal protein L32
MNTLEELQAVGVAAGALKPAIDLAQSLIGAAGNGKFRDQAVKLYGEISAAQRAELALLEDKRRLEAEAADLKAKVAQQDDWKQQKKRYRLTQLCPNYQSVGYALKSNAGASEAPHALCPQCFEDHKKRFLSSLGKQMGVETLKCSDCGYLAKISHPTSFGAAIAIPAEAPSGGSWMGR